MKLSRRSLFSLAFAAPAAAAAVPAKAAEPPITMRPTPECCRMPMVCLERWEQAYCARYQCGKCGRVAMIGDLSLAAPVARNGLQHTPTYVVARYGMGFPLSARETEEVVEKFRRLR